MYDVVFSLRPHYAANPSLRGKMPGKPMTTTSAQGGRDSKSLLLTIRKVGFPAGGLGVSDISCRHLEHVARKLGHSGCPPPVSLVKRHTAA